MISRFSRSSARLFLVCALLCAGTGITDTVDDNRNAAATALLSLQKQGFVGSVLVARNGHVEYAADFGFQEELTSPPSYWIASITKQFVAAGILLLHERGELDIHDSISVHLKDTPKDKSHITLFQLLTHTSGLGQNYAADGITDRAEALNALLQPGLGSAPGEEFGYANDNYNILAIILEVVSGKSYEEFLRNEIFSPTAMHDTDSWGMPLPAEAFLPPVISPMGPDAMTPNWGFRGATGMRASVQDLFSFLQSLEAGDFLSDENVDLLQGNHVQTAGGTEIGFNWFGRRSDDGVVSLFSRGQESFGGNAVIYVYPEQNLTIITATNAGPAETGDGPVTGWSRSAHEALVGIYLAD